MKKVCRSTGDSISCSCGWNPSTSQIQKASSSANAENDSLKSTHIEHFKFNSFLSLLRFFLKFSNISHLVFWSYLHCVLPPNSSSANSYSPTPPNLDPLFKNYNPNPTCALHILLGVGPSPWMDKDSYLLIKLTLLLGGYQMTKIHSRWCGLWTHFSSLLKCWQLCRTAWRMVHKTWPLLEELQTADEARERKISFL